ncbi:DNA recombination protein RmuC [Aeromicrobium duanguangcaii]|uniref:DNA recombination protein RmuC n=1 Tax=Aeromicrobium duanguangcaii TaxID=2968086 RepID=UPI002017BBFC|nr:DNA recombination protein RmuC [Aeromicrobium duanguangcaii]MCL3836327.1 DNA recombination protein RmuC [Aeromicrobium duanguangcaii]
MATFPSLTVLFALLLVAALAGVLGYVLGARERPASAHDVDVASAATSRAVAPVRESLDRFDSRLRDLEASRIEWHAQLREQVESVRVTGEALRRETASLSTALRRPEVRGRWGELHLRRTAELAGMVEHCDFDLQVATDGGRLRPDMVVRLVGDRHIVVDSKVPLDAFLDATATDEPEGREAHLDRHARQLRSHVDQLAAKSYWRQFESAPQFVVLFVPGESFLSAALEADQGLLEHAAQRQVVLASPTTLVALLRTVALAWTQESVAENAREIHRAARELYERLGTVAGHVDKLGSSLERAVRSYNDTVASVESRLLVSARRLHDLKVDDEPPFHPRVIEATPRVMTAPELLDELSS